MFRTMSRAAVLTAGACALSLVVGCGGGGGGGGDNPGVNPPVRTDVSVVSFSNDVQPIFLASCLNAGVVDCHAAGGLAPFSLETPVSYANLTDPNSVRVIPGDSANSNLYQRVSTGTMPPAPLAPLGVAQQDAIKLWIDNGAYNDLLIDLTTFVAHVNQLMEFRVVDSATGTLATKIMVDPLPAADFQYLVPSSVPPGNFQLDFYADLSGNRLYDPNPTDHEWSKPIPPVGTVSFTHDAGFTSIGAAAPVEGLNFIINFTGMTPHVGQLLELRLIDDSTGNVVGAYRLGQVPTANFTLAIPGVVDAGTTYRAEFYADFNLSGTYDVPPVDHAWSVKGTADAAGLAIDFAHNVDFTDIGF